MKSIKDIDIWLFYCESYECTCVAIFDHDPTESEVEEVAPCSNVMDCVKKVKLKDIINRSLRGYVSNEV